MHILPSDCVCSSLIYAIALFSIALLWIRWRRPVGYPPGPIPIPVIGNAHELAKGNQMYVLRKLRKQYGDIFSLSVGSFWVIAVNGRENLHELLVKRGDFTTNRPPMFIFKTLSGLKGIISGSGSEWKYQRTFALSKLRDFGFGKMSFESSIIEEVEMFLSLIESYNGQPFDISNTIHTSMSNIVMSIVVGRRFDYDDPKFKHFVELLNKTLGDPALFGPINFIPLLIKLPGDFFHGKRLQKNVRTIQEFFRKEITDHQKTFDENNIRDFIDVYLREMKRHKSDDIYTADQLLQIVVDLFAGGTETTATTIKWSILYLMHNQEVQKRMRREIDDVVGNGRLPSLTDKPHLPYCEAAIHESLRLGNILPFSLPHLVSDDIRYKGFIIPKNSIILPILDSVAHDETLFPDSNIFNPDRFIDTDGKLCGQENILTFSSGRRVCLGESLAKMELFLYMTSLVQRFEFMPPEGEGPPPIKGVFGGTYSPAVYKLRALQRN